MAIASFFVVHFPQDQEKLLDSLGKVPHIKQTAAVNSEKTAALLEIPASELTGCLKKISKDPCVLDLQLIFVNYEEDFDADGFVKCPSDKK